MIKVGDLVRLKPGGPVMTVEADRGNDTFTYTWFENDRPRSMVLPALLVVPFEPEAHVGDERDTAHRLPQAVVDLEERVPALENKVEARSYNTRSIYELHEEKIQILEARIDRLERPSDRLEEPTKDRNRARRDS